MDIKERDRVSDQIGSLDVTPVAGRIGGLVHNVDLSARLSDEVVESIRAAVLRYKVIFFRDQEGFQDEEHERLAAALGDPVNHPTYPVSSGSKYLVEFGSREGYTASDWHTDLSCLERFPEIEILRPVVLSPIGGDTLWTNTAAAYADLPAPLLPFVDGLRAIHHLHFDYAATSVSSGADEKFKWLRDHWSENAPYETEHPLVCVHPETGERHLLLGRFFKKFVDLNNADSSRIFAILQDHITKAENTVRWQWGPGDVAMWDNRTTQHRAVADFGDAERTLRRASTAGATPVGIDGRPSRAIREG